ncbi:fasciclin domain-containing protein [Clostridium sp.]|uniref:fasciclin domain-containing protein n=1 Tax=Clostridium sp. TaxID=1506 RepID=UPI00260D02C4|nr:fasciclin domain-containing protein [Clostridium sp.]
MKKKMKKVITLVMILSLFNVLGVNCYAYSEAASLSKNEPENKSQDIVDIVNSDARFKTLGTALKSAGLVDTLKGKGPFTVFAPTDEAFSKLPKDTVENLLKPENKDELVKLLTYHVAPGKLTAADVVKLNGKDLRMTNGSEAKIEVKNNEVFIDGAKIIVTDIMAKNGIIHVIDTVMIK